MQVAYILSLRRMAERARNRGPFWNHARYRRPIVFSTLAYPIPFCPVLTDPTASVSIRHSSSACNIRGQWRSLSVQIFEFEYAISALKSTVKEFVLQTCYGVLKRYNTYIDLRSCSNILHVPQPQQVHSVRYF